MRVKVYDNTYCQSRAKTEWQRRKMLDDPSYDPAFIVMNYDTYMETIDRRTDACGPIDDYWYVTHKRRAWKNKEKKKRNKIRAKELKERKEKRRAKELEQKEKEKLAARKTRAAAYPKYYDTGVNHMREVEKTDIPFFMTEEFYETDRWKEERDKFLAKQPKMKCQKCGAEPDPNYKKAPPDKNRPQSEKDRLRREWNRNRILVDHVLPVKYFWNLRLDPENFQLLCGCCNEEKLNTYRFEDYKQATIRAKKKQDAAKTGILAVYGKK